MQTHDSAAVITVLDAAGEAGVTPLLCGDPGIGKSSLVRGLADLHGVRLETVYGSLSEPADIGGLPVVADGAPGEDPRVNLAPRRFARDLTDEGVGYLFLEELTDCAPAVQSALLGVALDHMVGELTLPPGVKVIAACNPPARSTTGQGLPGPMANRLLHINWHPSAASWFDGMLTGFTTPQASRALPMDPSRRAASRAAVVAFLDTSPTLLHAYPEDPTQVGGPWPSRRSWTLCADVLACLPPEATTAREIATAGLVGDGAAHAFRAWRENCDLPLPADVIADPDSVAWEQLEPSRTHAVIGGVVAYAAGQGTQKVWRAAWGPLGAAAEHGSADVAAWGARRLARCRPANAVPPKDIAAKFADTLSRIDADRATEKAAKAAAADEEVSA